MIYRQKKPKNIKVAAKTKTNMKNYIRGLTFCTLWFLSIVVGFFFLVCPILPLVIISPKIYRKLSDRIFGIWEPFPAAVMEVCLGIRVILSGDKINPFEGSLFVMNHRTRVDWNFLWLGLFHCCQPKAHNMKYVLKAPIMHLPGAGWVMQTCSFIFIYRDWHRDKAVMEKMINYLNESDSLYQILLFPEGTDLSETNLKRSHKYADENNLQRYYKVLHPKTTGFAFLARKMKSVGQLKAVYDVTIAYPKTVPLTERDLLRGRFPEEVHFHIKRYSSSNIPYEEEGLRFWLNNIWREKEQKLQNFYSTGSFFGENPKSPTELEKPKYGPIKFEDEEYENPLKTQFTDVGSKPLARDYVSYEEVYRSENYRPSHLLYLVLVFWITLIVVMIHQLMYSRFLQIWVLVHSLLFAMLSLVSNGFHQIAASAHICRYKKKPSLVKKFE